MADIPARLISLFGTFYVIFTYSVLTTFLWQDAHGLTQNLTCYCEGHCPGNDRVGTCQVSGEDARCYSYVEEIYNAEKKEFEEERSFGCLHQDTSLLQCKSHLSPHKVPMSIECCFEADLCNKDLRPMYNPTSIDDYGQELDPFHTNVNQIALLIALSLCILILFGTICCAFYRRKRIEEDTSGFGLMSRPNAATFGLAQHEAFLPMIVKCGSTTGKSNMSRSTQSTLLDEKSRIQDLIDQTISSGSGSGLPRMVQRTIARQITLIESIGKGRYGEVWKAQWRSEYVACKIFYSTEETSWFRETEIYQTTWLRHDNILGFIAADIRGTGSWTQLLLLTNYHEHGSLHDYLTHHDLDEATAVEMVLSITKGLTYLHEDVTGGNNAKPPIAHRDIKSKNILVKRDGQCCIADFGLAVRRVKNQQVDIPTSNTRVGTKRYMAPEVLDETLNPKNFDSFRLADMYSFGLVIWEITARTRVDGVCEEYRIPYHDCVPSDPSFDEMRKVVCGDSGIRPDIPERCSKRPITRALSSLMMECWRSQPSARLSAARVLKNLNRIDLEVSDARASNRQQFRDVTV